jgi:hypothetical protein
MTGAPEPSPEPPQVEPTEAHADGPPIRVAPRRRWRPPLLREPLVVILAAVGAGLWLVWAHHPRKGLATIALALGAAALLRLVLPPRDAGLLVVRGRVVDVAALLLMSGAVVVLAVVQHFPGPGR